jgi:hypothetical protein
VQQEKNKDDLIRNTVAFWQSGFGLLLSEEQARQIIGNVSGYFSLLTEWNEQARCQTGHPDCNQRLSTTSGDAPSCRRSRKP